MRTNLAEVRTDIRRTVATTPVPDPRRRHRLVLAVIGPLPVSLVGLSTFGWLTFRQLATAMIPPATLVLLVVITVDRGARRLAVRSLVAGLAATFVYDLLRWVFLLAGWMDRDPIPHLGTALGLEPGWVFGYLWRFVGNGGGLALSFIALRGRGPRLGAAYGLVICSGLLAVLVVAPNGQIDLFPLTTATLIVAVAGHLIYGTVLGLLAPRPHGRWAARGRPPRPLGYRPRRSGAVRGS